MHMYWRARAATKNNIKWECSSQMLSLLLQKQRRHVKQHTQAWHRARHSRARHSEVMVAMLIGPPKTLRSCSPMLGETTPKNHSAVKKVVPKTGTLLSRGNRRIRGNCFSVFQKSSRDNCSRSATALDTRGAYRCDV